MRELHRRQDLEFSRTKGSAVRAVRRPCKRDHASRFRFSILLPNPRRACLSHSCQFIWWRDIIFGHVDPSVRAGIQKVAQRASSIRTFTGSPLPILQRILPNLDSSQSTLSPCGSPSHRPNSHQGPSVREMATSSPTTATTNTIARILSTLLVLSQKAIAILDFPSSEADIFRSVKTRRLHNTSPRPRPSAPFPPLQSRVAQALNISFTAIDSATPALLARTSLSTILVSSSLFANTTKTWRVGAAHVRKVLFSVGHLG